MKTSLYIVLLVLVLLFLAGCSTFTNALFLVNKVENAEKARVLAETGVELFDRELIKRENYRTIDAVQRYFTVALSYDSGNRMAQRYLERIRIFRNNRLEAKTIQFQKLLVKAARTEKENYMLCLLAQQCLYMDPKNPEVKEMKKNSARTRAELVKTYRKNTKAALEDARKEEALLNRESPYMVALKNLNKTLSIDPGNSYALSKKRSIGKEMEKIFEIGITDTERMIRESRYVEAEKETEDLEQISHSLDYQYDSEVSRQRYWLYYFWAQSLYEQEKLDLAEVKINKALAHDHTTQALSTRTKIKAAQNKMREEVKAAQEKTKRDAAGENLIHEIKGLINRGMLVDANNLIVEGLENENNTARARRMKDLQAAIRERLSLYYDLALAYYRQEDFARAIDLFSIVVGIDVDYKNASDYLAKSQSKQKLLESIVEKE
jgi:hypothetical protein